MSLRAAQKQMTYELFLTKALELFGTKGYAATTIDDIATAAGSTRTTFYLHFASKAEVMSALLTKVDAILTTADDPTLTAVVASGSRDRIQEWLDRKFSQWDEIKPYLTASYQAAHEPDVAARTEQWFEDAVGQMTEGLNLANRFPPDRRRIRCVLAFGQLEYLSRRYFSVGWRPPREICLDELTGSWCHLLASDD
ncbi:MULTISPECIES: TetR/AcrR family transcriptional regulator [Rhodococcus]|uniref:TetR/AcrR family transcriptional regulator n=1 Tax=Rhodococcus aetherivorans TaxID=191292 RepID=A0AA46NTT8_9NOCA|nr:MULTISPECIES: TetR/AcrR family transcriptional regulator [Rhodococcus]AKE89323.1 TetR family transcriptional regulator [Rhodococcus aetherivorans]ANZ25966.1 TetR family transcriptional regulator [Rhodococcus sp. WB1]MBC2590880.1 TetR/AcrR family transcriptional regulator [Rhodococcus aetherivorans]USC17164.1 TetR/AcrR family transcriptional regulator [Rhodococcus sp. 11-3]UYF92759.1 TetR/AcrR family transcriptional regulator [Rhodococcus aetherivorans]